MSVVYRGDTCILTRLLRKQTEEADEAKRAEKQKKSEEHRVQQKVAAAVSDAKVCDYICICDVCPNIDLPLKFGF